MLTSKRSVAEASGADAEGQGLPGEASGYLEGSLQTSFPSCPHSRIPLEKTLRMRPSHIMKAPDLDRVQMLGTLGHQNGRGTENEAHSTFTSSSRCGPLTASSSATSRETVPRHLVIGNVPKSKPKTQNPDHQHPDLHSSEGHDPKTSAHPFARTAEGLGRKESLPPESHRATESRTILRNTPKPYSYHECP